MKYRLSRRSKRRLKGINRTLYKIAVNGVKTCPIDYGITLTGGLRTAEDQNKLYKDKASKCDGYKKKSYHQSGNAFDLYAYVNGKASWNKKHYKIISKHLQMFAFSEYGIILHWGGDWKSFYDGGHFQIKG